MEDYLQKETSDKSEIYSQYLNDSRLKDPNVKCLLNNCLFSFKTRFSAEMNFSESIKIINDILGNSAI